MIISTEAIVLKSMDFRETSRIVTFFTRDEGKVKGVLKGIRKDLKKFGSNVDKFSVNDMVYYRYSRSDLHLISQCDLKQFFFPIRQDYRRSIAANYCMELVDMIMPVEEKNLEVYQLIMDYLTALEDIKDIDKLVHIFQIKILALSGFRPHIDACVKCMRKAEGRVRFSMSLGGLVCPECSVAEKSFRVISQGAVSSMLHIEQHHWPGCLRLGLTLNVKNELKYFLNNFLVYHLEKKVKSAKFLIAS